jgi:carbon storage regulator CsrA
MLVLSRKVDESFYLYIPGRKNPIKVTNVKVEKGKARLGVEADTDITVVREELVGDEARRAAKKSSPPAP